MRARLVLLLAVVSLLAAAVGPVEAVSVVTSSQEAKLTPSSNTGPSSWGSSVAVSGDTLVVGSACCGAELGIAEVFVRSGSTWSWQATLSASDTPPATQDLFGRSVAIEGDVAIVGAPDLGREAAYVFRRTGATWVEEDKLTPTPNDAANGFGWAVAISGNTVIVGAYEMGPQGAFIFVEGTTGWTQEAFLPALGDAFGHAVALEGDVAAVGAFGSNAAYVYSRSGTTWTHDATLTGSGHFGQAVAIRGGRIAVGAPDTSWSGMGAAFVFSRSGGSWAQTATLTPSDSTPGDFFGYSIALSGHTLVVGAPYAAVCADATYVFLPNETGWTEEAKFVAEDPNSCPGYMVNFGDAVAVSSDTVVVGAPWDENGIEGIWGAAYVFRLEGLPPNGSPTADAGPDQTVASTTVELDGTGSTDPEGDPLTYTWTGDFTGGTATGPSPTVTFGLPDTFEVTLTVDDDFGGVDSDSVSITVTPDTTAPTVTIAAPTDGSTFTQGATALSSYLCIDNPGGSGIDSCVGDVPNGAAIDTATLGPKTFTVTGTDNAGNSKVVVSNYTVVAPPPVVLPTTLVPHDVGLVTGDNWQLRNHSTEAITTITFGVPGDYPIMGDWDCDGIETPGLFRQAKPPGEPNLPEGLAYYRNDNQPGVQIGQFRFVLGNPGDIPLAGDFNGDGCDSLSVYRPSEQRFYIADELPPPIPLNQPLQPFNATKSYIFGDPGDKPFVGDFDGDGIETVGLHRESTGLIYYLNSHPTGSPPADVQYVFGDPGDRLVAGDWVIVDGKFTPALFRSSTAKFFCRDDNTVSFKPAAAEFPLGTPGSTGIPVSGAMGL